MEQTEREFRSILFAGGEAVDEDAPEPEHFHDLNLDQIVDAVLVGREEYALEPFFRAPLTGVDEVRYRHEVFRDLERADVHTALSSFARDARRVRVWLELVRKQRHGLEKRRWHLDAAELYCATVTSLSEALDRLDPGSRGLCNLREHLRAYTTSETFTSLAREANDVLDGLARVRYKLRIKGTRITVGAYDGEPDYTEEVAATFARFRSDSQGAEQDDPVDSGSMNHVEARIARLVARLHPDEFRALDSFWSEHRHFSDPSVTRFERELQLYLAWLEHVRRLEASGLAFCLPTVEDSPAETTVEGAFDLALAAKLVAEGGNSVTNGFALRQPERILVVSGPNQGGKTTFARMMGQLHELARLGLPVPGRDARLPLVDAVLTHFEREERLSTLRGKLEDELVRVREILERATGRSLVVLNEIFSSTTLEDAILLGSVVLEQLTELGCVGVCVTFVDELASLNEATVSMVAAVDADDPSRRTFEILRRPADGRAYASAIADKYGLSYERLRGRLA
jgi:DNA mismatch repair protein MutS